LPRAPRELTVRNNESYNVEDRKIFLDDTKQRWIVYQVRRHADVRDGRLARLVVYPNYPLFFFVISSRVPLQVLTQKDVAIKGDFVFCHGMGDYSGKFTVRSSHFYTEAKIADECFHQEHAPASGFAFMLSAFVLTESPL
jgi:hypothetical protein